MIRENQVDEVMVKLAEEINPPPDGMQDPSCSQWEGSPVSMPFHTDLKTLRLTAWKPSGVPSRIKAFQSQLSGRSSLPLDTQQCTRQVGKFC